MNYNSYNSVVNNLKKCKEYYKLFSYIKHLETDIHPIYKSTDNGKFDSSKYEKYITNHIDNTLQIFKNDKYFDKLRTLYDYYISHIFTQIYDLDTFKRDLSYCLLKSRKYTKIINIDELSNIRPVYQNYKFSLKNFINQDNLFNDIAIHDQYINAIGVIAKDVIKSYVDNSHSSNMQKNLDILMKHGPEATHDFVTFHFADNGYKNDREYIKPGRILSTTFEPEFTITPSTFLDSIQYYNNRMYSKLEYCCIYMIIVGKGSSNFLCIKNFSHLDENEIIFNSNSIFRYLTEFRFDYFEYINYTNLPRSVDVKIMLYEQDITFDNDDYSFSIVRPPTYYGKIQPLTPKTSSKHTPTELIIDSIKFIKIGKIGSGATGEVYKVQSLNKLLYYACKITKFKKSDDIENFDREVEFSMNASKLGISPKVYYSYIDSTYREGYMISELCDGSIESILSTLSSKSVSSCITKMLRCIRTAFENNMYCIDTNCSNFVYKDKAIMMIDFSGRWCYFDLFVKNNKAYFPGNIPLEQYKYLLELQAKLSLFLSVYSMIDVSSYFDLFNFNDSIINDIEMLFDVSIFTKTILSYGYTKDTVINIISNFIK